tara:strand:- start:344 stop:493 length:150 start_codon:yes stop_codon:yes gene_type:complete
MEKIIISMLNNIIEEIRDIIAMLHPLNNNTKGLSREEISFVGDSSDEDD